MAEVITFIGGTVLGYFVARYRDKLERVKSAVEAELKK